MAWAAALLAGCLAAGRASAVQILVQPGDDWSFPPGRVNPGDEIVLMPGKHVCATLDGLVGRSDAPIVIRPLERDHKVTIEGGREGLRLRQPRHVEIRDLTIRGTTLAGIMLRGEAPTLGLPGQPEDVMEEDTGTWGNVTVERVRVEHVGPKGQRHGFLIAGLTGIRLDRCSVTGWGGSAVEMVNVQKAVIHECTFTGQAGYSQMQGLRARAGCRQIDVRKCFFTDAGSIVLGYGGTSHIDDFGPAPVMMEPATRGAARENATEEPAGIPVEVNGMQVDRCLIVGGGVTVDMRAAQACALRNCTIVRPRNWVLRVDALIEQKVRGSTSPDRSLFNTIVNNIIVWHDGEVPRLMDAGKIDAVMLQIEQNIWWGVPQDPNVKKPRRPTDRTLAGTITFPQEMSIDPELDEFYKPKHIDVQTFGVYCP